MKTNILYSLWLLLLVPLLSFTQSVALPDVIPSSPEVAAIQRYSEVPISHYNGIPNINIPLCELEGRELSVPVSLSYHAGGHRVNEEASWVGLGWNLIAGGQITRTVRGIPDDLENGYVTTNFTVDHVNNVCLNGGIDQYEHDCVYYTNIGLANNEVDLEPDDFRYNMLGQSGRFMFNQNRSTHSKGEIIPFEGLDMKIECQLDEENPNGISSWTITDPNGIKYKFDPGDRFLRSDYYTQNTGLGNSPPNSRQYRYTETWNLTSVAMPNGDIISFEYDRHIPGGADFSSWDTAVTGETLVIYGGSGSGSGGSNNNINPVDNGCEGTGEGDDCGDNDVSTSIDGSFYRTFSRTRREHTYLTKITSSKGYIEFIRDTQERIDVKGNRRRLKYINVYNKYHELLKEIEFQHGYFNSEDDNSISLGSNIFVTTDADVDALTHRLFLDQISVKGGSYANTGRAYKYEFNYNSTKLPNKWSKAQDHWGYYNGASNNSLIPVALNTHPAANREVNTNFTQAHMLKRITYPEGGTTDFEYENNEIEINNGPGYANSSEYSGGIRIKRISNSEGQSREFTYRKGFQISRPFYWELQQNGRLVINSTSSVPLYNTQSGYVGYEEVDERISTGETLGSGGATLFTGLLQSKSYTINRTYKKPNTGTLPDAPYVDNLGGGLLEKEITPISETTHEYNNLTIPLPHENYLDEVKGLRIRERYELNGALTIVDIINQNLSVQACVFQGNCDFSRYTYSIKPYQLRPVRTIQNMTNQGEEMTTITETNYQSTVNHRHYLPTSTTTTNSEGRVLKTQYYYPFEARSLPNVNVDLMNALIDDNQINIPVQVEQFEGQTRIATNRTVFGTFTGSNSSANAFNILPVEIQTAKHNDPLEIRMNYINYTPFGQPQEVALENGTHIVYLWDDTNPTFDYNYPIAKIENATLQEVQDAMAANNNSIYNVRDNNTLPNAFITTYTYRPMVGIVTMIDPRGYRTSYTYDDFNRLETVKDRDGHILTHNIYHYKN